MMNLPAGIRANFMPMEFVKSFASVRGGRGRRIGFSLFDSGFSLGESVIGSGFSFAEPKIRQARREMRRATNPRDNHSPRGEVVAGFS
jgi:hypothetical protein